MISSMYWLERKKIIWGFDTESEISETMLLNRAWSNQFCSKNTFDYENIWNRQLGSKGKNEGFIRWQSLNCTYGSKALPGFRSDPWLLVYFFTLLFLLRWLRNVQKAKQIRDLTRGEEEIKEECEKYCSELLFTRKYKTFLRMQVV